MATVTLRCDACGQTFSRRVRHTRLLQHAFCSKRCMGASMTRHRRASAHHAFTGGKQQTTCSWCGKTIMRWPFQIRQAKHGCFCDRRCLAAWQEEHWQAEGHPAFTGTGRNPHYGKGWKQAQQAARERDAHTCQHCGLTAAHAGREPDVHHITPFPQGDHSLANLICLCVACHRKAHAATQPAVVTLPLSGA